MMNQLRNYRVKTGMSMRSSANVSTSFAFGDAFSRKSIGDNLSNILRPGIQQSEKAVDPSVGVVDPKKITAQSSLTITPASKTSRAYDAQMMNYGVQMGFGAVPSNVQMV
jgi:hypothetical protein